MANGGVIFSRLLLLHAPVAGRMLVDMRTPCGMGRLSDGAGGCLLTETRAEVHIPSRPGGHMLRDLFFRCRITLAASYTLWLVCGGGVCPSPYI